LRERGQFPMKKKGSGGKPHKSGGKGFKENCGQRSSKDKKKKERPTTEEDRKLHVINVGVERPGDNLVRKGWQKGTTVENGGTFSNARKVENSKWRFSPMKNTLTHSNSVGGLGINRSTRKKDTTKSEGTKRHQGSITKSKKKKKITKYTGEVSPHVPKKRE